MAPAAEPIVLSSSDEGGDAMAAGKSPCRSSSAADKKKEKESRKGGEPGEEKTTTTTKKEDTVEEVKKKKKPSKSNAVAAAAPAACTFPMSRVSRFVRSECGDTRTSPDAIFLINKASEMFLELFVEGAFAKAGRKKNVSYDHLSSVVHEAKRYDFLSDFIPEKVRAEDALKAMTSVET